MLRYLFIILAGLMLASCACSPALITSGGTHTNLLLVTNKKTQGNLSTAGITGLNAPGYDPVAEQVIVDKLCTTIDVAPLGAATASAIFSLAVEPLIKLFVDNIEARIKQELEDYTATYGALASTENLYSDAFTRDLALTCFRFTRSFAAKSGNLVPAMDLIAQVRSTSDGGAMQIRPLRPLRLYYGKPEAKGDKFGLAISVKAEAIWRENNKGMKEEVFSHTILTEKRDFTGKLVTYYYDTSHPNKGWDKIAMLPMVPVTTQAGAGGNVTFNLSVAEVGNAPKYLEKFSEIFSTKKGDLTELLNKAVGSALGTVKE